MYGMQQTGNCGIFKSITTRQKINRFFVIYCNKNGVEKRIRMVACQNRSFLAIYILQANNMALVGVKSHCYFSKKAQNRIGYIFIFQISGRSFSSSISVRFSNIKTELLVSLILEIVVSKTVSVLQETSSKTRLFILFIPNK